MIPVTYFQINNKVKIDEFYNLPSKEGKLSGARTKRVNSTRGDYNLTEIGSDILGIGENESRDL